MRVAFAEGKRRGGGRSPAGPPHLPVIFVIVAVVDWIALGFSGGGGDAWAWLELYEALGFGLVT